MNEIDLTIPDFLRRERTPESDRACARHRSQMRNRKIKNPPKRASKKAKMFGLAFGQKVVTR